MDRGVYKYIQCYQTTNGNTLSLSQTSTTQSIIPLPVNCVWNPAKSYFSFDMSIPATASNHNILFTDVVPINSLHFQTTSGFDMCYLQNVEAYTKIMNFVCTPLDDYLSRAGVYGNATNSLQSNLYCCNPCDFGGAGLTTTTLLVTCPTNQYICAPDNTSAATAVTAANAVAVGVSTATAYQPVQTANAATGVDKLFIAPQRLLLGSGTNTILYMHFTIPLSSFPGSILSMNRDIYFGSNQVQFNIQWSAMNKIAVCANALTTAPTYTNAAAATLNNLYFWMAKQVNINIAAAEMAKYSSGVVLDVPYTQAYKNSVASANSNFGNNIAIPSGSGMLKRIVFGVANYKDQNELAQNFNNVAQVAFSSLQTFMDGSEIQAYSLSSSLGQDYDYLYPLIKGTPAALSRRCWQINSFWIDDFSGAEALAKNYPVTDFEPGGLETSSMRNYLATINVTSNAGCQLYTWATFGRKLYINNNEVRWVV